MLIILNMYICLLFLICIKARNKAQAKKELRQNWYNKKPNAVRKQLKKCSTTYHSGPSDLSQSSL